MKIKDLELFIKNIQMEFSRFLYEYEYVTYYEYDDEVSTKTWRLEFPHCCKLASNLISSYLTVHTEHIFKCIVTTGMRFNHCWCECEELGIVIDLTNMQFDLSDEEKELFRKYLISDELFESIIYKSNIIFDANSYIFNTSTIYDLREIENLAVDEAKSINCNPWILESFMKYIKPACDSLKKEKLVMSYS